MAGRETRTAALPPAAARSLSRSLRAAYTSDMNRAYERWGNAARSARPDERRGGRAGGLCGGPGARYHWGGLAIERASTSSRTRAVVGTSI
ncbi:hypothetical protein GCM10009646_83590 [Streptomyces aureus]